MQMVILPDVIKGTEQGVETRIKAIEKTEELAREIEE